MLILNVVNQLLGDCDFSLALQGTRRYLWWFSSEEKRKGKEKGKQKEKEKGNMSKAQDFEKFLL